MVRPLHAFLFLALLAGCDRGGTRREGADGREPAPAPANSFHRDDASGEVRARIVADGKDAVTLRSGDEVPVRLPPGFTLYPGARVIANTAVERGAARRVLLVFETPDPLAKVMLFYRAQAQGAGVALTLDLNGSGAASIGGHTPAGSGFTLTARRVGERTRAELGADEAGGPAPG